MENENRAQVTRAATVVMAAILVSRILGSCGSGQWQRCSAEQLPLTPFAAFALPDLMYQLLVGGALSSAFIPVFTEYLAKDEERKPGMWRAFFLTPLF